MTTCEWNRWVRHHQAWCMGPCVAGVRCTKLRACGRCVRRICIMIPIEQALDGLCRFVRERCTPARPTTTCRRSCQLGISPKSRLVTIRRVSEPKSHLATPYRALETRRQPRDTQSGNHGLSSVGPGGPTRGARFGYALSRKQTLSAPRARHVREGQRASLRL